jgi:hypothetical protein
MLHVYLTDAEPLTFIHTHSAAGTITRPAVTARSYRVGRTGAEIHAVLNARGASSEYLRVEFKTLGTASFPSRIHAPPVGVATASVVEVTIPETRITRITVAPRESVDVAAGQNEPALLIALTDGVAVDGAQPLAVGQERFVDGGRRAVVRPQGFSPVQLLRVDFLTRPAGNPK